MALNTTLGRVFYLSSLSLFCIQSGNAGTLRKTWELDLRKWYKSDPHDIVGQLPVSAVMFSPDGERIAIVIRRYGGLVTLGDTLFVAAVHDPEEGIRSFEIKSGSASPESTLETFSWSSSGQAIEVDGGVIRLSSGTRCQVPEFGGFISDDRIIAEATPRSDLNAPLSEFKLFDLECRARSAWNSTRQAIVDISQQRGLLLVHRFGPPVETLIVSTIDGHVIHRWRGEDSPNGKFANSGKSVCGWVSIRTKSKESIGCWDVDSGKQLAISPINGGDHLSVSARAHRIAASDYHFSPGIIEDLDRNVFQNVVVWDFESGETVVSWRPKFQAYETRDKNDGRSRKHVREPAKFAISPDGETIADGADGVLRLYKIEK